ncbi:hypothetical protein BJX63DRAFT_53461 [Aspergillus granulosus]|uniref:Uncharacterized protein n=1 Tax=Aspergillus granulosus TaxID=176169 RepID=A0ABR4GZH0_9EURO
MRPQVTYHMMGTGQSPGFCSSFNSLLSCQRSPPQSLASLSGLESTFHPFDALLFMVLDS